MSRTLTGCMSNNVVLITTYELGHQPFGIASAAAWLRDAGASVTVQDLSINSLDEPLIDEADMVGIYIPMHTATRLAEPVIRRIKERQPRAHVCLFGLYAAMNDDHLRSLGADTVLSGEFEHSLVEVFAAVASDIAVPHHRPISLRRQQFKTPDRTSLPGLDSYPHLRMPDGKPRVAGYTEATRGCKHRCRHCPIVPIYDGQFVVVAPDVVLADIGQQVAGGASHITFGDPDFFNGPAHSLRIVQRMQEEFEDLTYDVTIKVEHLKHHVDLLPQLVATGCVLVTTAIESFDNAILERFAKNHSADDLTFVLGAMDSIGLALNPTFVTFTPWTTVDGFIEFLDTIVRLGLVPNMSPVQYAIRLLIPAGSRLLDLPEVAGLVSPFDDTALCHPWTHPDPAVDDLFDRIAEIAIGTGTRAQIFEEVWQAAHEARGGVTPPPPDLGILPTAAIPYLTEPWYC